MEQKISHSGIFHFVWRSIAVCTVLILSVFFIELKDNLRLQQTALQQEDQAPLYLPEAKYVRLITLGFDNFFSDILWFNTINYFGKQYRAGRDYRWLDQMCEITSELDKKAFYLYEFCATMLSWMAKQPEASNEILSRGIEALPDYWRLRFLRGFNYWYFLNDQKKAAEDFRIAATYPEAPSFLPNLASRLVNQSAGPESAITFLDEMIRNAKDSAEREALIEKRKLAQVSLAVQQLTTAVAQYQQKTGKTVETLEELFENGMLQGNLLDPFGGKYFLNKNNGTVETTSGKSGLDFKGKSIDTGLAADEWKSTKK